MGERGHRRCSPKCAKTVMGTTPHEQARKQEVVQGRSLYLAGRWCRGEDHSSYGAGAGGDRTFLGARAPSVTPPS